MARPHIKRLSGIQPSAVAPHLSPGHTLVSLDLSAIGAGQARAYQPRGQATLT